MAGGAGDISADYVIVMLRCAWATNTMTLDTLRIRLLNGVAKVLIGVTAGAVRLLSMAGCAIIVRCRHVGVMGCLAVLGGVTRITGVVGGRNWGAARCP